MLVTFGSDEHLIGQGINVGSHGQESGHAVPLPTIETDERHTYTCHSMCMPLSRRVQLLLDPARYERLERAAARSGSSVASVIREAIDRLLPEYAIDPASAGMLLLDAPAMPVEAWDEMKQSFLDEMTP
jgi:hypothetical protein